MRSCLGEKNQNHVGNREMFVWQDFLFFLNFNVSLKSNLIFFFFNVETKTSSQ